MIPSIKDPNRAERAGLVRAATAREWSGKTGAFVEKVHESGLRLVVRREPDYILDADGEVVGVDAWVQLFDGDRELPIDPHRRIINPPNIPRPEGRRATALDPLAAFWQVVWDSVLEIPNESGWRTRGTVTTVFANAAGVLLDCNHVVSVNATYATARSGSGLTMETTAGLELFVGQRKISAGNYVCWEAFMEFDTSAITDTDVVSDVALGLYVTTDTSAIDFVVEARDKSWGADVGTSDWVAGASLGSQTLLATLDTNGLGSTFAYKTFTADPAFLTITNMKTGTVQIMLNTNDLRNGDAPAEGITERIGFSPSTVSGTAEDPKLTITHAVPVKAPPIFSNQPNRIWRI